MIPPTIKFVNGTDSTKYDVYIYESTTLNLPSNLNKSTVIQVESGKDNNKTLSNLGYLWVFLYPKDTTKSNSAIVFDVNNSISSYYVNNDDNLFTFIICDNLSSNKNFICSGSNVNVTLGIGVTTAPNTIIFIFPSVSKDNNNPTIFYNNSQNLLNQVNFWIDPMNGSGLQKTLPNSNVLPITNIPSNTTPVPNTPAPVPNTSPSSSPAPTTSKSNNNNWIWWVVGIIIFILIILVIIAVIIILKKKKKI